MDNTEASTADRVDPQRNKALRHLSRFNGIIKLILRSPFHRVLSRRLLLLTYNGSTTGRQYTLPLRYLRMSDGRLMVLSRGTGWSKRVAGRDVAIRLVGREYTVSADTHDGREDIAGLLAAYARHAGPPAASRLYLGLPADRPPTADELRSAADRTRLVLFDVG